MQTRQLEAFESIVISGRANVAIAQDSSHTARISAGEHLLEHIRTEVRNGVLYISDENGCNWLRDYDKSIEIDLSVASLHTIDFQGAGDVRTIGTLRTDSLRLEINDASGAMVLDIEAGWSHSKLHTGPGDVVLRGSSGNHFAYSAGNGYIDCSALITPVASAINLGTGDISVYAGDYLSVEIRHTGWVRYGGNPSTINSQLSGDGQLIAW